MTGTTKEIIGGPFRRLVREWMPPALLNWWRTRRAGPSEWEYRPAWDDSAALRGWDQASVAEMQARNWSSYVELTHGVGPLGINHTDPEPHGENPILHNLVMTFGYVLARAAGGRPEVSILDWGGGAGHYLPLARALLPGVRINYVCKDVPVLCELGRRLLPDAGFVSDVAALGARKFDLVLASGSLHYSRDWAGDLQCLGERTGGLLLVTRLPLVQQANSFVVLQRAYSCGYNTEYQGWFLNRGEFLQAAARCGLALEREFLVEERPEVSGAPERGGYRGFLFRGDSAN